MLSQGFRRRHVLHLLRSGVLQAFVVRPLRGSRFLVFLRAACALSLLEDCMFWFRSLVPLALSFEGLVLRFERLSAAGEGRKAILAPHQRAHPEYRALNHRSHSSFDHSDLCAPYRPVRFCVSFSLCLLSSLFSRLRPPRPYVSHNKQHSQEQVRRRKD